MSKDPNCANFGPSIPKNGPNGPPSTPYPPSQPLSDKHNFQFIQQQHVHPSITNSNPPLSTRSPKSDAQHPTTFVSQPIQIPAVGPSQADPNQVSTPLTARGEKKGHFFPYSRTPSPHGSFTTNSPSKLSHSSSEPEDISFVKGSGRGRRRSSSSHRSLRVFSMHSEQYSGRYTPTSPLSPKFPSSSRPLSPQPANMRPNHTRQTSRNLHMTLPRYHPANFQHHATAPTSGAPHPTITLHRANAPTQLESPRSMREKQRELLDSVRLSSILAASPAGQKPGSPRLDPLGSPKGPVTPLALEESTDYFSVAGAGKPSPAASPGAKSARSDTSSGKEEGKSKGKRQVEIFQ